MTTTLTTSRLRLEPLEPGHLAGLNEMNADPEVMRHLAAGRPETIDETRAIIERVRQRWAEFGYSWWAFVEHETQQLVGAGAIQNLRREGTALPDPTCPLEIGWRLRRERWGRGLAVEAARAMGDFAFKTLDAPELLSVCDPANTASANVMKRLGMREIGVQRWYGKELLTYRIDADRWIAAAT
ncbi:MAG: GNAT family N-acetyltransferase [Pseudomonadota bacterium]